MLLALLLLSAQAATAADRPSPGVDPVLAERFARLALDCVGKEYPNKIAHVMSGDADVRPARELTPAFFGCFDWHSSVHGHWLLARVARLLPETALAAEARRALGRSLTPEKIAAEVEYLNGTGRASFERPYGLAWLLQLAAELHEWSAAGEASSEVAQRLSAVLRPLEQAGAARLREWLPKLTAPIRSGEHSQTAFAFGLVLDWARSAADGETLALLEQRSRAFYGGDRDCPLAYEPSGEDFLSPCLGEADLMRRVLSPGEFARWLADFLPHLPSDGSAAWLAPGIVTDPTDPKLAHLDGLNLSRAFMLEGIAASLGADDARSASLLAAAARHRERGLAAVTGEHYEGGHWLGTFAVYLVTARGLGPRPPDLDSPGVVGRPEPVTMTPVDLAGMRALAKGEAGKLRLINVWATWCGPCLREFPDLVSLYRSYLGRPLEVVTLNVDDLDQKEKARAFLSEQRASMRNLSWSADDPYGMIEALDRQWEGGLPYTLLVAPGGRVLYRSGGAFDTRELRRRIDDWLAR